MRRNEQLIDAEQEFRFGKNAMWKYCDDVFAIENQRQHLKTNHRRQRIKDMTEPA